MRHRTDIIFDAYIEAHKITREKKKYVGLNIGGAQLDEIEKIRYQLTDDELFTRLANSIAP